MLCRINSLLANIGDNRTINWYHTKGTLLRMAWPMGQTSIRWIERYDFRKRQLPYWPLGLYFAWVMQLFPTEAIPPSWVMTITSNCFKIHQNCLWQKIWISTISFHFLFLVSVGGPSITSSKRWPIDVTFLREKNFMKEASMWSIWIPDL